MDDHVMNLQEIKKLIVSQREEMDEKFRVAKIVEREPDVNNLRQFLTNPNILAILGIRRYGKSIFSWQIFRNEMFGYINFDDERLFGFRAKDFDLVLQAFYELYGNIDYIILDEPQNVERWELFANRSFNSLYGIQYKLLMLLVKMILKSGRSKDYLKRVKS